MTDLHADAVQIVAAWTPPDADQAETRTHFLDLLAIQPDACRAENAGAHITASAAAADSRAGGAERPVTCALRAVFRLPAYFFTTTTQDAL